MNYLQQLLHEPQAREEAETAIFIVLVLFLIVLLIDILRHEPDVDPDVTQSLPPRRK